MKHLDKALIGSGVALLLSGGIAAAALGPTNVATAVMASLPGDVALAVQNNGHIGGPSFLATAATYIGITEADLRTELDTGQTLAQIAAATAGKSRDGLIQALVADATKNIDAGQTAGKMTADQATQLKTNLTQHITSEVDSTRPGPGFGSGRGPGR